MRAVNVAQYRQIVILTGAGVSVASGIRPFRGPGGLYTEVDAERIAHKDTLESDPHAIWRLFGGLRDQLQTAQPNAAHRTLADVERRAPGEFTLITQNIDGLHARAGSQRVLEFHGSMARSRCSRASCDLPMFEDTDSHQLELPRCPRCGAALRPDIVLFGEEIPPEVSWQARQSLRDCDLFVAVGTSGTVTPAASLVRGAEFAGARTILVNLEPMQPPNPYFQEEYTGRAEELLPLLFA